MSGFKITRNMGFHITFENGSTVSVQFGYGNYCENRDKWDEDIRDWSSRDAEIAAWDAEGNWIRGDDWTDDVHGWQTPAEVLAFINKVANA